MTMPEATCIRSQMRSIPFGARIFAAGSLSETPHKLQQPIRHRTVSISTPTPWRNFTACPPSPPHVDPLPVDCRAAGQENRGGRVRELESQLEEVRSHYHHRLRSLENQLQVLTTPLTCHRLTLPASSLHTVPVDWACLLSKDVLEMLQHPAIGTQSCWWDNIGMHNLGRMALSSWLP